MRRSLDEIRMVSPDSCSKTASVAWPELTSTNPAERVSNGPLEHKIEPEEVLISR